MKRLSILVIVMALMCLFAVSVSAQGATDNGFGTVTEIDGITAPTLIDTTSRVVIEASDGTFYTFPSYYILADDSYFTWVKNDALNEIIGVSGSATDIRKQIVRMEIPEGIEDMNSRYNGGANVFEDATKLVEVTLPSSLTKMGGYVFNRCNSLVTINGMDGFMQRAQMIGTLMLNGTAWGEGFDLVIPTTITEIPDSCFQGTKIASVTFHDRLVQIGSRSFQDCVNLTSVTLPSSLVTLKNHSFAACTSLSSVDMSKCTKLTSIGEYCFEKAVITSFDFTPFAKTIISMGQGVFNRCQSLTDVIGYELCDNITSIGANMFQYCPLTALTFPKNITSIGNYAFFQHGSMQTELKIPNGVTTIGDHAFVRSTSTKAPSSVKIYLPGKLTTITGNYNFEYWKFTEMYIPKTLASVSQGFVNGTLRNGVVYYYTGTYDAENTESNLPINSSNNHALLEAEWIDFDDFAGASSDKNYIVYNYNHCDAFYYGYDYDKSSTNCTQGTTCSRCGRTGENFTPYEQHNKTEVLIMPSFTEDGIYNCECANDGCTAIDVKDKTIKAIFTAKGYSTNPEKNAINGGYTVELDSLALYNRLNGAITYGVVIANAEMFGDKSFFDENNKVNTNKALQVEIDCEYTNFDCSIRFGSTSNSSLKLVICAYVIEGNNVTFIQADSGSDITIGAQSFKSVTLAQVVALVPVVSKEN